MSDVIKLNIKSKNLRAVIADSVDNNDGFTELPEVIEREKQEHAHKIELENEYKKGFEEGKIDATEHLKKIHSEDLLKQSQNFYSIISTFEEKLKIFENDFHSLVINVAEKIAAKIVEKEIEHKSTLEQILEKNLRKIIGANDIVIKLNPEDNSRIQKSSKEYLTSSGITKIRFEANENIQIGGCLIESEIGNLDARIETQINEIIKALENHFNSIEIEWTNIHQTYSTNMSKLLI